MDEVTDPTAVAELRRTILRTRRGAIEAHDVRTRMAGSVTFVEFHLVVPRRMTVEDAHAICDRIERALREQVGVAVINISSPSRRPSTKVSLCFPEQVSAPGLAGTGCEPCAEQAGSLAEILDEHLGP